MESQPQAVDAKCELIFFFQFIEGQQATNTPSLEEFSWNFCFSFNYSPFLMLLN